MILSDLSGLFQTNAMLYSVWFIFHDMYPNSTKVDFALKGFRMEEMITS